MDYLRLPRGGIRYDMGRDLEAVAKRVEAAIIRHVYPEMTALTVPLVFAAARDFPDATTWTESSELTGRFNHLSRADHDVNAESLGLETAAARAA